VAVEGVVDFLRGAVGIGDVAARLADQFEAVDVAVVEFAVAGAAAGKGFVDDLRVAGGVQRVDQEGVGDASDNFFDAVAAAVNKIREALGDSAANPRFVETLPKRGYRFIAEIRPELPEAAAPSMAPMEKI
jgi:hypothetical protein